MKKTKEDRLVLNLHELMGKKLSARGYKPDAVNRIRATTLGAVKMSSDDANRKRSDMRKKGEAILFGLFDGRGTQTEPCNLPLHVIERHISTATKTIQTNLDNLDLLYEARDEALKRARQSIQRDLFDGEG